MADKAMDVYLNDHLAGAMLGRDLAQQLEARNEGTALGELMASLSAQIEEDRQTLIGLMERLGTSRNPVKQASAWVTEKASRVKLAGLSSGEADLGQFMGLEMLALGVQGKLCLWTALKQVVHQRPELASVDLDELSRRAQTQYDQLERERLSAGQRSLAARHVSA